MGAWGEKMLDNDSAMDTVTPVIEAMKKTGIKEIGKILNKKKIDDYNRLEILGIAAYLVEHEINIPSGMKKQIWEIIGVEYDDADRWKEPSKRRRALTSFEYKLNEDQIY